MTMIGDRWGIKGPPPEAYSRVTNPERFAPLHVIALERLDRLQERFDVERVEGYGLDPGLEQANLARPSVKLIPADSTAAPIVVAFTRFPAVFMRCGRWLVLGFPTCGCDACDETVADEEQRLTEVMNDVVSGRFRESIRIPLFGDAKQRWEIGESAPQAGGWARIPRSHARALVEGTERKFNWSPWPLRLASPHSGTTS